MKLGFIFTIVALFILSVVFVGIFLLFELPMFGLITLLVFLFIFGVYFIVSHINKKINRAKQKYKRLKGPTTREWVSRKQEWEERRMRFK